MVNDVAMIPRLRKLPGVQAVLADIAVGLLAVPPVATEAGNA
jgi:hypothetical protein